MRQSWKQGRWTWFATTILAILAVNWYGTLPPEGFIQEPDQSYDYIIVGAGTSGCVLAAKLSAADPLNRILLIEAGGEPPWYSWIPLIAPVLQGTRHDWKYKTTPQKNAAGALHNNQSFWPQGKMVGGSGQMNFLIHSVGSPSDYDSWQASGWDVQSMQATLQRLTCLTNEPVTEPLGRRNLFLEEDSEMCTQPPSGNGENSTHCTSGSNIRQCPTATIRLNPVNATESPLTRAFLEAGKLCNFIPADMNQQSDHNQRGAALIMASQNTIDSQQGRRWSTYQSYLLPALKKSKKDGGNLHVLTESSVSRILFNKRNNKPISVNYLDRNGYERSVQVRKEIVLSAGSIKSPQILQLSGIGPAHVLESLDIPVLADLPVGENLQDHLQVPLFVELNSPVSLNVIKMLHPLQLWNYIRHGKGAWATSGIEGIARLANDQGMLILFNMGSINADVYTSVANIKKEAFHQWFPKSANYSQEGFVFISICLHPRSRGHVRIRTTDPTQSPEIDPAYLSNPYDVQCTIDTIRQEVKLLSTEPFKALGAKVHWPRFPQCGDPEDGNNSEYMECLVRMAALTVYHPVGTNSMGKVLDSQLRIRGVPGVRVVDASAMPTLTSGPPNSVLVAMAERASEFIINMK